MKGREPKSAAIFDLDKTVLATSSALALQGALRRAGLLTRRNAAKSTLSQLPYLLWGEGEARNNRIRRELGRISHGWNIEFLDEVVAAATRCEVHPLCYVEALDQIAVHRAAGHAVVIASASPLPLIEPLGKLLNADFVLATTVEVADGKLTGEVNEFNHGQAKARAVQHLAQRQGWDLRNCWAYSDSASDLPLLELVGNPVAVNPDRTLRSVARTRGWTIRHFSRTLRLRPARVAAPALVAIMVVMLTAALVWRGRRVDATR